jgi:hypothetical protein
VNIDASAARNLKDLSGEYLAKRDHYTYIKGAKRAELFQYLW